MSYMEDLFSVRGKTALVTGGATGIGRMIATGLISAGANVLIASRKVSDCERVAAELNEIGGGRAEGFGADVATEEGIAALAADVAKRTDRLHILVNNAGASWGAPLGAVPYKAWAKVLDVNLTAVFHLTQQLLPLLEKAASADDPARVINLGSVMGTLAITGVYSYSASKAAVHQVTRMLALELAPRHVTVNAFAPGPFQSRMMDFAVGSDEKAKSVGDKVPLGRIGVPDDIAGATLYLCSRAGRHVTGAILPLDGGQSIQHGVTLFE
ncbi:MAG TPA: SDR family oxidoreductase [Mesorhizobium sp.]